MSRPPRKREKAAPITEIAQRTSYPADDFQGRCFYVFLAAFGLAFDCSTEDGGLEL